MAEITIKQGEGKWLKFTIIDPETKAPPTGLSSAEFAFAVKAKLTDTAYAFYYEDTDFDKTQIASGIVKVKLLPADNVGLAPRQYVGELQIDFGSNEIDKSRTIIINIEAAVIKEAPEEPEEPAP